MNAVLLDTDVFSYLLRPNDKRGDVYRKHVHGKTIAVSFVTIGELYFGVTKRGWGAKTIAALESSRNSPI